ncbi:N-acetyltransferase [Pseudohoeflea suaedae]|uniref:N-acetyltransferase n=1 Tax=Pseudohoeflea suaedae TaxID=877384 RepID=A0A4R5PIE6_9HYPH|nr:GNAT family protein [Pseudohoeflea suaedae]TDH35009.1 N-acetyltransferase [Pseudohoeflea suaedae]
MSDLSNWQARPAPAPVALTGRYAMIEPYRCGVHLNALWDALGGSASNELLRYFPNGPYENADQMGEWIVGFQKGGAVVNVIRGRRTGNILGMASYMRPDPANGVVEVGSVAHSPLMQRSPISTEVHYLLARHVFEDLGYRRYEWKCHNENAASKRTAERLGFTFEGIFRQHLVSKGANRDTAWYSIIDGEWPSLKTAFEDWLAPANFDAEGRQIERLEAIRASQGAG